MMPMRYADDTTKSVGSRRRRQRQKTCSITIVITSITEDSVFDHKLGITQPLKPMPRQP